MTLCIGQLHSITVYSTILWCALFWCWVLLCVYVTNSFIECYFVVMVATIIGIFMAVLFILNYTLGFLKVDSSGSATTHLPGCFWPWTFYLIIGLDMLPSDSCMSCLDFIYEDILLGSSRLCNLLSLRYLVPWITTCLLNVGPLFGNLV